MGWCKAGFKLARVPESNACVQSARSVLKLCEKDQLYDAWKAVNHSLEEGLWISEDTITVLVQRCIKTNELVLGRRLYSLIAENRWLLNVKLGCQLIRLFTSCGSLPEALQVFSILQEQNVNSCTPVITANAHNRQDGQSIVLLEQMKQSALKPSSHAFVAVLKACASFQNIDQGMLIHGDVLRAGLDSDLFVGSSLVNMYTRSGSLEDAYKVFNKLEVHDVVLWNVMIGGYSKHGKGYEALQLYLKLQDGGTEPNKGTFLCILKACVHIAALDQGKLIHGDVVKRGLESDLFLGSILVDMYAKCSSIEDARIAFDNLPGQDVAAWNAMIVAYAKHEHGEQAMDLFKRMQEEGIQPDKVTYVCILKACVNGGALKVGRQIHADIGTRGCESDLFVASALVDMHAKCGNLKDARTLFNSLLVRDVVSWSVMIGGYTEHGQGEEALQLFEEMQKDGVEPNRVTYISVLKACASLQALDEGKLIHAIVGKRGFESGLYVGSSLIDTYAKCGSLQDACKVFDMLQVRDVVLWNAMMAGYAEHEYGQEALQLFGNMQQEGAKPDKVTFVYALKACASTLDVGYGRLIHADIIKQGLQSDPFIRSSLVYMYAKGGSLGDAHLLFTKLFAPDVVAWNTIIAVHVDHDFSQEALHLFDQMKQKGPEPDDATFVCILKACSSLAALDQGKLIHQDIMKCGLESYQFIGSTLIDMYAKCGSLEDAHVVFERLPLLSVVDWNAMISGYANHGYCSTAQYYFESMQQEGLKPNDVTFVSLLSACSHAGLLREGHHYFTSMMEDHDLTPTFQHYVCMVDLFGRAGRLSEAEDLVIKMPFSPDAVVWIALLGSCAKYGNLELGRQAFNCLLKVDCRSDAGYVLMSNIYAVNNMWDDVQKLEEMIALRNSGRLHEMSWTSVNEGTYSHHE